MNILNELKKVSDPKKAEVYLRFFKTGKGEYGEGDKFLGITMPNLHKLARRYFKDSGFKVLKKSLESKFHEERMFALLVLVYKYELATKIKDKKLQKEIFDFYLKHRKYINNWDLVDVTAPKIVGHFLYNYDRKSKVLEKLAESKKLWDRRIAIISLFYFIRQRECKNALVMYKKLLNDERDLIHKAIGWMLREIGKNCGEKVLEDFLIKNKSKMARTILRYAIERFPENKRKFYLKI